MREYIQKEHMDKKKKPIDLSDWEDYYDPVSQATTVSAQSSQFDRRKDRSKRTGSTAVSSPVRHWSTAREA